MTIATENDVINARTNKRQGMNFQKASIANMVAGALCSMYRSTGPIPSQPAIPAAAALCTKALTWNFNNPTAPDKTYLDVMDGVCSAAGRIVWFDRLFHIGGLSGTVTTAQAVNSQTVLTLPVRDADPPEVEWFIEWYTDTGATAVTATVAVTYTDASTGTPTVALAATMRAGRLLPIIPAAGKVIASIQSVTLSATTGTAGSFGITAGNRISGTSLHVPVANIAPPSRELIMRAIPDDSCLWPVVECSTTSSGDIRGEFTLIQG